MKLKQETKVALNTFSYDQYKALQDLCDTLTLSWSKTTFKKDTEFDTIWAVASFESKTQALAELMQILHNPELK